jgi:hypothetical protein
MRRTGRPGPARVGPPAGACSPRVTPASRPRRPGSQRTDPRRPGSRRTGARRPGSQRTDSQRTDPRRPGSRRTGARRPSPQAAPAGSGKRPECRYRRAGVHPPRPSAPGWVSRPPIRPHRSARIRLGCGAIAPRRGSSPSYGSTAAVACARCGPGLPVERRVPPARRSGPPSRARQVPWGRRRRRRRSPPPGIFRPRGSPSAWQSPVRTRGRAQQPMTPRAPQRSRVPCSTYLDHLDPFVRGPMARSTPGPRSVVESKERNITDLLSELCSEGYFGLTALLSN